MGWCGHCHNHQNLPGWRASQQQAMSAGQASDHLQSCEATIFEGSALSSTLPSKRLCNATQRGGKAKQCKKQGICRTRILLRCFRRLATAPDGVMLCLAAVSFVVLNAVTFIYNKTSRQLKTKISVPSSRHPSVPGLFPSHRTNGFSSDSKLIDSIHSLHLQPHLVRNPNQLSFRQHHGKFPRKASWLAIVCRVGNAKETQLTRLKQRCSEMQPR